MEQGNLHAPPPHGLLLLNAGLAPPDLVAACADQARPGFTSEAAHEYRDSSEVFAVKLKALADLIRGAKRCVAYTGAGLSTAAGIGDYATKAEQSITPTLRCPEKEWPSLRPTAAHRALVAMHHAKLLHGWVQQNHDGLPQKAGLSQASINEIHGSWFDPANPTVGFGEPLREDLFADMLAEEVRCDLCLALGTSLCDTPSTADRIAVAPALRSLRILPELKSSGGLVIASLQRTRLDDVAALRIYACLDDVFTALASELDLELDATSAHDVETAKHGARKLLLNPGEEAVVLSGPDRGCPIRICSWTKFGDLELQLLGSQGAPPRRALLGPWWLGADLPHPPLLGPRGTEVPPTPSLVTLLPLLPPWAAAMLGMPPAPRSGKAAPLAGALEDVGLALEGLWEGSAASIDAGPHRAAQPLRLVLAWSAATSRVFGGGYTAWPAASVINSSGSVFFTLEGEVRADGRVRLVQRWEHGAAKNMEPAVAVSELLCQAVRDASGCLQLAGAFRRSEESSMRMGALVLTRKPVRWAGRWNVEFQKSGAGESQPIEWALAAVPPLLFGAAPCRAQDARSAGFQLLRGAFDAQALSSCTNQRLGFELWSYAKLPMRGSNLPILDSANSAEERDIQVFTGVLEGSMAGKPRLSGSDLRAALVGPCGPSIPTVPAGEELAQALRCFYAVLPR